MGYKSRVATCSDEEFAKTIAESYTYKEALSKLGYHHSGGAYITLRKRIKRLGLSTEHMTPKTRYGHGTEHIPDDKIFTKDSIGGCVVRRRVLKRNLIPYKCAICGQEPEWNGEPLTLTLDHINGDHFDNRVENLRFVCPNCDTQQDTYGAKNKRKYGKVGEEKAKKVHTEKEYVPKISKEELLEALITFKSFKELGKRFNMSDNGIRKWCKKYNLPRTTNLMKDYVKNELLSKTAMIEVIKEDIAK